MNYLRQFILLILRQLVLFREFLDQILWILVFEYFERDDFFVGASNVDIEDKDRFFDAFQTNFVAQVRRQRNCFN